MSSTAIGELPEALRTVRSRLLFALRLEVPSAILVGAAPGAHRRIGLISGGSFQGERLSGQVLEGGSDWQTLRVDGAITLDVRIALKTQDDALISMRYFGVRHGAAEVMRRLDQGEQVDPSNYYLRIAPRFETASEKYAWLNRVIAIGVGQRLAGAVLYSVFEVL